MNKFNDAINICLQTIGEQSLDDYQSIDGIYEAEEASRLIDLETTKMLTQGWNCNTDEAWVLTPDTGGYITVPSSSLRIDSNDKNIIVKAGKLYDKDNMTYKFDDKITVDIVWDIPFDDVPSAHQYYVSSKAARLLYQRLIGDSAMTNALQQEEQEAYLNMMEHEIDTQDYNIFDNTDSARVINRTTNPQAVR